MPVGASRGWLSDPLPFGRSDEWPVYLRRRRRVRAVQPTLVAFQASDAISHFAHSAGGPRPGRSRHPPPVPQTRPDPVGARLRRGPTPPAPADAAGPQPPAVSSDCSRTLLARPPLEVWPLAGDCLRLSLWADAGQQKEPHRGWELRISPKFLVAQLIGFSRLIGWEAMGISPCFAPPPGVQGRGPLLDVGLVHSDLGGHLGHPAR